MHMNNAKKNVLKQDKTKMMKILLNGQKKMKEKFKNLVKLNKIPMMIKDNLVKFVNNCIQKQKNKLYQRKILKIKLEDQDINDLKSFYFKI